MSRLQGRLSGHVGTVGGMAVAVLPPVPKIRIRPDFEWIGDEERGRINDWLAATFGHVRNPALPAGSVVVDQTNRVIYADEGTARELLRRARQ